MKTNKILQIGCWIFFAIGAVGQPQKNNDLRSVITETLKKSTLEQAEWAMTQSPVTVTAEQCERSAGGLHDFYSEGDYWWQNPDDPNGPYIQRDGQSNPSNFTAHRKAMVRFSQIIGSLASAYLMTKNEKYVKHAFVHLKAWFMDEKTYMNPSLLYTQAIKGRATGRGIGIIDMIQMMEVAQGIRVMENAKNVKKNDLHLIKNWFGQYLEWVTSHQYGIDERDTKNNHATCWVMQVAVFAKLVDNQALIDFCKNRFKTVLLPNQLEKNGSFPLELKRTKPYGYSLFNLDAMTTVCHVLSDEKESLWDYTLADGRTLKKAIEFMYPFVEDKSKWPYAKDMMYWDEWPVAQPFLLFGYQKYPVKDWLKTWKRLEHFPTTEEVVRNLPIRNPLIWIQ
ncbi:alginate lyase family protein [Runella sp.]|uniref:alginate lyase family protein n=1 Tax=Runella sp. TaxID=1960881 RepID=UPI0030195E7C